MPHLTDTDRFYEIMKHPHHTQTTELIFFSLKKCVSREKKHTRDTRTAVYVLKIKLARERRKLTKIRQQVASKNIIFKRFQFLILYEDMLFSISSYKIITAYAPICQAYE